MLSVGVDELSNSVIISAPQGLLNEVLAMIDHLDQAARPMRPVTQVFKLSQPGAATQLRDAFSPGSSRSTAQRSESNGASGSKPSGAQQPNGGANGNGRRNGGPRNGNGQPNVQVN
jgi:hypothetical protein